MRTARILPVVLATLLLAGLVLPAAQAVPSATPMANTLQFYGGEVRAVAQIGNTIYVGGSFTGVREGAGARGGCHVLAALDMAELRFDARITCNR